MLAIIGVPPFPVFLTKFLIVQALWLNGSAWLAAPFLLFLIIIIFGMSNNVFKMAFGSAEARTILKRRLTASAYVSQCILLLILFVIGLNMPGEVYEFLRSAAGFFR